MSTPANIGILHSNGKIESVYCHFDGYLDGVGEILNNCYNNTELVQELIHRGDFRALMEQPYKIEFYNDGNGPDIYSVEEFATSTGAYNYVWIPSIREWFVACVDSRYKYVPLEDALKGKFNQITDITFMNTPNVSGGMNPSRQEVEDFFTGASTMITKRKKITAAEDEEFEDPRIAEADDLQERVEDDFDYVMTGIERLSREGMLDEAIELLNTLADTLDSAIGIIGGDFESGSELPPEEE